MSPTRTSPRISVVGVHVLDTHVIGVESIPSGSDGQLVETIRMSAAGTAGGTGLVLARLGAEVSSFGAVGDDMTAVTLLALLAEEGVDITGLVRKGEHQTSSSVIPVRPSGERPAWHCIGANGAFTLEDLDPAAHLADHVHLGGPEFLGGAAAGELLAAAESLGVPHPSGRAAMRMLENEGFAAEGYVDIFDGGPTMTARTSQVRSVRKAQPGKVSDTDLDIGERALIATGTLASFRSVYGMREIAEDGSIAIDAMAAQTLEVGEGDEVWSVAR